MNHAHAKHYTEHTDPRVPHVLHGWRDYGGPAEIDLTVGDMHVSNLPTDIRNWLGGTECTAIRSSCSTASACASHTCRTCIIG